jgi:hypothetical protein
MANPTTRVDAIIKVLADRIGELALVYKGWPNDKHVSDLRRARCLSENLKLPEVSITEFERWPNHLDINVWAQSRHVRDEVSRVIIDILDQIKEEREVGVREIRTRDVAFEEKGVIRPGKWDIVTGGKPVFRKLLQVDLS